MSSAINEPAEASVADEKQAVSHLENLLEQLRERPQHFHFFQAIRILDCYFAESPQTGFSLTAKDDPIRLAKEVSMLFAPATLARVEPENEYHPLTVFQHFLGLHGPQAPLPLHLTEYMWERIHNHRDPTLARFLDLFHHRMLSFYYRAWARVRPTVSFDHGARDRFGEYVAAFFGMGMESLTDQDDFPDLPKRHFAGLMSHQSKNAEGLLAMLRGYFRMPVDLEQFVGQWINVPDENRCRMGVPTAGCQLGMNISIGGHVWDCQQRFRITFGPLSLDEYFLLLPGERRRQDPTDQSAGDTSGQRGQTDHGKGYRLLTGGEDKCLRVWDIAADQDIAADNEPLLIDGHRDSVSSVAVSPNGMLIASLSIDQNVVIRDAETGREIRSLPAQDSRIVCVAFSNDNSLAGGCEDGTVRVWSVASGEQKSRSSEAHDGAVVALDVGSKCGRIVSADANGVVKVSDAATGLGLATLIGSGSPISSVCISADGGQIVSGNRDGVIQIWDGLAGQISGTLTGHKDAVTCLALSDDGKTIASSSADKCVRIWDATTFRELVTLDGYREQVALSPDGQQIAVGDGSAVRIWDAATGEELSTLKGHDGPVTNMQFFPVTYHDEPGDKIADNGESQDAFASRDDPHQAADPAEDAAHSLESLVSLVRGYVGDALDWDLNLILKNTETPPMGLGIQGHLGWSSWLLRDKMPQDADDLKFDAMSRLHGGELELLQYDEIPKWDHRVLGQLPDGSLIHATD